MAELTYAPKGGKRLAVILGNRIHGDLSVGGLVYATLRRFQWEEYTHG